MAYYQSAVDTFNGEPLARPPLMISALSLGLIAYTRNTQTANLVMVHPVQVNRELFSKWGYHGSS